MYVYIHVCTYAIPTLITEAFCFVTEIQLLSMTVTVNKWLIQHWVTLIGLVFVMHINAKATPINETD